LDSTLPLAQHPRHAQQSITINSPSEARYLGGLRKKCRNELGNFDESCRCVKVVAVKKKSTHLLKEVSIFVLATRDLETSAILHFHHGNRTLKSQWLSSGDFLYSVHPIDNGDTDFG
jgi:hypothetical protein